MPNTDFQDGFVADRDVIYGIGQHIKEYYQHATTQVMPNDCFQKINIYNTIFDDIVSIAPSSVRSVPSRGRGRGRGARGGGSGSARPSKTYAYKANSGTVAFNSNFDPNVNIQKVDDVQRINGRSSRQEVAEYETAFRSDAKYGYRTLPTQATRLQSSLKKSRDDIDLSGNPKDSVLSMAAKDFIIRRSCKFGLTYFMTQGKFGQGDTVVHYALDDINIDVLLHKTSIVNNTTGVGKVPICTSELRFLFRNWKTLGASNRVKFYMGHQEVAPPWTLETIRRMPPVTTSTTPDEAAFDYLNEWVQYAEKLARKKTGVDPSLMYDFESSCGMASTFGGYAQETIKLFHQM
ncbi:hypothetical protein [Cystobacter ferrugineus]|uniref:Uncharacterized protein n=1 Tax=Cystobacter ferrugineus TaxID=83449 RepID=A0A1L9AVT5_9BACT|nr:hypothetical protein [Cystobacter ferrugineus]OJH34106.1 hypothetical protein BON30_44900 [Cystobacter ferrugineus]